jgi:hypothetical protein
MFKMRPAIWVGQRSPRTRKDLPGPRPIKFEGGAIKLVQSLVNKWSRSRAVNLLRMLREALDAVL